MLFWDKEDRLKGEVIKITELSHHGEILQGIFEGEDKKLHRGLVTLKCNIYGTTAIFIKELGTLRGLGNSIMPKNLEHSYFNEIHWIEASQAYKETRNLHEKYSLFMGGTSGAAYSVAKWYHKRNPSHKVIVLFPDQGYRYQDTIYNDTWIEKNNLLCTEIPEEPQLVKSPKEAQKNGGWSRFFWNNRTYEEVMEKNE